MAHRIRCVPEWNDLVCRLCVRRTLLGDIAGNNNVGVAMSLDSATTNVTRMLGPLLGGVIYAASVSRGLIWLDLSSFLVPFISFRQ
ncbi:MAG: hypothetical protein CM1200mP41_15360 [Gammaproteobacteria bacterium]|nr:MAG: hypothetical protein CM1200mP41_15360 [Gammaproteobacteria bacterium]